MNFTTMLRLLTDDPDLVASNPMHPCREIRVHEGAVQTRFSDQAEPRWYPMAEFHWREVASEDWDVRGVLY